MIPPTAPAASPPPLPLQAPRRRSPARSAPRPRSAHLVEALSCKTVFFGEAAGRASWRRRRRRKRKGRSVARLVAGRAPDPFKRDSPPRAPPSPPLPPRPWQSARCAGPATGRHGLRESSSPWARRRACLGASRRAHLRGCWPLSAAAASEREASALLLFWRRAREAEGDNKVSPLRPPPPCPHSP